MQRLSSPSVAEWREAGPTLRLPEGVPVTHGWIERVRLVSRAREQRADQGWWAVPGTAELTDVRAAPARLPSGEPRHGQPTYRATDEVLVDLRLRIST